MRRNLKVGDTYYSEDIWVNCAGAQKIVYYDTILWFDDKDVLAENSYGTRIIYPRSEFNSPRLKKLSKEKGPNGPNSVSTQEKESAD